MIALGIGDWRLGIGGWGGWHLSFSVDRSAFAFGVQHSVRIQLIASETTKHLTLNVELNSKH